MELLERDDALAALAEAHEAAARGHGRVVFVTGEPGIGKTSLVTRFVRGLDGGTRTLVGTCDDLTIPRPLGPIRDLVGTVSAQLESALAAGAASHEIQRLLIAELEQLPPSDGARARGRALGGRRDTRHDHRPGAADRLAAGAARSHLPRRRGALASCCRRRDPRGRLGLASSSRRSPSARSRRSPATMRVRSSRRPEATRSTSPSCLPHCPAPTCPRRSRTRCSAAPRGSTMPHDASSSWCRWFPVASGRRCSTP